MSLKTYKITLIAKGPVFVGDGKYYTKKEYFPFGDKVNILDINKFYGFLRKKKLDTAFEEFILDTQKKRLDFWLKDQKLLRDAVKYVKYSFEIDTQNITELRIAIKDAYGNPYIPGSSLKGALRTILAAASIADNENLKSKIRDELESGLYENTIPTENFAESKIFRTLNRKDTKPDDAVNDIMQGFIVGDSEPLSVKNLILAQKIDRHKDGKERSLPILRESLKPGTKIVFPLTIDEDIFKYSIDDILKAIGKFDELYNYNFLQKFEGIDILRADKPQIFIGGGAGFVSKTLIYPIMGKSNGVDAVVKIFGNTGVPFKHKHNKDKSLGVSPHIVKFGKCDGQTLQMGLCEFQIDEVN